MVAEPRSRQFNLLISAMRRCSQTRTRKSPEWDPPSLLRRSIGSYITRDLLNEVLRLKSTVTAMRTSKSIFIPRPMCERLASSEGRNSLRREAFGRGSLKTIFCDDRQIIYAVDSRLRTPLQPAQRVASHRRSCYSHYARAIRHAFFNAEMGVNGYRR